MSLSSKSLELASELLANGEDASELAFGIEGNDREEVVVIVVRRGRRTKLGSLEEWAPRIQFQDSGAVCTRCNGTGRV